MTVQAPVELLDAEDRESAVARYLAEHPAFFLRHPSLVRDLEIPHPVHGAVSLIEHRVHSLRKEAQDLRGQMAGFVDNARSNEELARRLHALLLELLEADRLDELLATLYQALEQRFQAELTSFRLFTDPISRDNRGLAELVGPAVTLRRPFQALLDGMEPRCGAGDSAQLAALFAERACEVGSVALIPIAAGPAQGVLAVASRDPHRHRPGTGTHYLRQLGDVVGRLVARVL